MSMFLCALCLATFVVLSLVFGVVIMQTIVLRGELDSTLVLRVWLLGALWSASALAVAALWNW